MNTEDRGFHTPNGFLADEFVLRPIRATDAECDYDAVMETRDFLRDWEGTGWPDEGFTVEANREDLARLERRHQNGESFTYIVVSLTNGECLGCVYIFPTSAKLFTKAKIELRSPADWSDFQVAVYFWVRKSRMADMLDERLLRALDLWLRHEWHVDDYLLITNELAERQVELLGGTGRTPRFELSFPNKPVRELAYA